MPRTLSSPLTFLMKYVFPTLYIGGFGYYVLWLWMHPESAVAAGARGPLPPGVRWGLVAMWLLGSASYLWSVTRLKRVRLDGGALLVSNYRREIRVPLTQVVRITQKRWPSAPITVDFRFETPLGKRITFLPPDHFRSSLWHEDPLVGELRALAGLSARAS